jgi:hypothetical protein
MADRPTDSYAEIQTVDHAAARAEQFALYQEYLTEFDRIPVLRDPVMRRLGDGGSLDLDSKVRAIVRDEVEKLLARPKVAKRRKRRKRA